MNHVLKSLQPDARALFAALHDSVALCAAIYAAAMLIDADGLTTEDTRLLFSAFTVAVPIQVAVNLLFGIYQGTWRYTSLPDIQRIVFAVLCGTVATSMAFFTFGLDERFGYREYILYPLFLIAIMSTSRMAFRSFKE